VLGVAPASAHTDLLSSDPADDAALDRAPATVRLVFGEPMAKGLVAVVVERKGDRANLAVAAPGVAGTAVTQRLPGSLPAGEYRVRYRVVALDGHPVTGEVRFVVRAAAARPSGRPTAAPGPSRGTAAGSPGRAAAAGTDPAPSRSATATASTAPTTALATRATTAPAASSARAAVSGTPSASTAAAPVPASNRRDGSGSLPVVLVLLASLALAVAGGVLTDLGVRRRAAAGGRTGVDGD
jgi:methionine-rich copper-binding protein CopC